jgi:putative pyruvate formate lyase activating enzyme
MELLAGVAEVYIADFKFGNDQCAKQLSGVENYLSIVARNLKTASRQGRLIVRHLLLPGHYDCCLLPVVKWMREHLPDVEFSLRDGYLPAWRAAGFPGLDKPNSSEQIGAADKLVHRMGLRVIQ